MAATRAPLEQKQYPPGINTNGSGVEPPLVSNDWWGDPAKLEAGREYIRNPSRKSQETFYGKKSNAGRQWREEDASRVEGDLIGGVSDWIDQNLNIGQSAPATAPAFEGDAVDMPDAGQASGPPTAPVAVQGDGGRMSDAGRSWPSRAGLGAATSRADRLAVEIGDLDSRIEAAGSSIEKSESKVESYSERFREQDPDKFKNAVDAHNALIEEFNSLLKDRQEKYRR